MLKTILKIGTLATGLLMPGVALAAVDAIVTTDLNIRTGPGTGYQRFDTVPDGSRVIVYGCGRGYDWCDIGWRGTRGWVSGNYLAYRQAGDRRPIPDVGVSIDLPIIGLEFNTNDRRGRDRPRYRDGPRHRDAAPDWRRDRRHDRSDIRRERRDVRDARKDLREARRELRDARRSGENIRDERRTVRDARRDLRQERRELRRERRRH